MPQTTLAFGVEGNTIELLDGVATGSQVITIRYNHDPVERIQDFLLAEPAAVDNMKVYVNDQLIGGDQYQFVEETNTIRFNEVPEDRSTIRIQYRFDRPLPNQFVLPEAILADSLSVSVGGEAQTEFSFDVSNLTLSLSQVPGDGEKIVVGYNLPGDKSNRYGIEVLQPENIESISVVDAITDAEVEYSLESGVIIFPDYEVKSERKILVRLDMLYVGEDLNFQFELLGQQVGDRITVLADGDPDVCSNDVQITGQNLTFRCDNDDFSLIEIRYSYVKDFTNEFPINLAYSIENLRVTIDGVLFEGFEILGSNLVIPADLVRPGAAVQIDYL